MAAYLKLCAFIPLALCGCSTAWNVATLPVKGASKAIDWTTTSQDEADRNAGRTQRKAQNQDDRRNAACNRCASTAPGTYFVPIRPDPSIPIEDR